LWTLLEQGCEIWASAVAATLKNWVKGTKQEKVMMPFIRVCWRHRRQAEFILAAIYMLIQAIGVQSQTPSPSMSPTAERRWVDAWAVSYLPTIVNGTLQAVPTFHNQTMRLNMFLKLGGVALRVKLTNRFSTHLLAIGGAHVALRRSAGGPSSGSDIVAETDHVLTFNGARTLNLDAGNEMWSDPVDLGVKQHQDLTVSLFLPESTTPEAFHPTGLKTQYIAAGDHCGDATLPLDGAGSRTTMYFFVAGIQVLAPAKSRVIVALGDSITDGAAAADDAEGAWPDVLSKRLPALQDGTPVCVINMGIGSNRLATADAAGPAGLKRLEEDAILRPNVSHLILLEGINDISYEQAPAEKLIAAYEQVLERAHAKGIKVFGATLLPIQNSRKDTPANEATRQEVNRWIREARKFDAVLDFEKVVQDPQNPLRIRKDLTTDYVHPNTEGYRLMGESVSLNIFE
jgi:lysophospholipase L1-like esterase